MSVTYKMFIIVDSNLIESSNLLTNIHFTKKEHPKYMNIHYKQIYNKQNNREILLNNLQIANLC